MLRSFLTLCFFLFLASFAKAQLPPPCPSNNEPGSDICEQTCIYCNFVGYTGSSAGYTGQFPPGGFCGTIENEQWFGFIASCANATFSLQTFNCQNNNGLQIALYPSCTDPPIACNGGIPNGANQTLTLPVSGMTPGANYFLLIDGYAGGVCDFTINVVPAACVQAPNIGFMGQIMGPTTVCPGATVTYTIPAVSGAGAYTWSAPPGALINGQAGDVTLLAPDGNTVQVTFGPNSGSGQVCVTAANSCFPGQQRCRTINIQPLPPTQLPPQVVCNNDIPYELPWGQFVTQSGTYQTVLTSWLGCDSLVRQTVTVKPPLVTNLNRTICAGGSTNICGNVIDEGGFFQFTCQSFQGCDSLVNVTVNYVNPNPEILGGGTITCSNPSVTLTAGDSPPPGIPQRIWRNVTNNNTIIGTGPSITVTSPGTYSLTVTHTFGGTQCSAVNQIVIPGDLTPPTVTAQGSFIGCGGAPATLGVTTNATNPTYAWTGPNGFTSNEANPVVTVPGAYTVVVTNSTNGCTASAMAQVTGNIDPPIISATGATLDCNNPMVTIQASSNAPNSQYAWTGPNGFTSNQQNPGVSAPGTYTLVVTNLANNCTASTTATVDQNLTQPGAGASVSGPISCPTPSVTLSGTTNQGVNFSWSGPNGFSTNTQTASANLAGDYVLTVTGANGCTSTASVTVTGNTVLPDVAAAGGVISCAIPTIALSGSSNTNGVTYAWTGPNGFSSNQQNPTVSQVGQYILSVTAPNNCVSSDTAVVVGDFATPDASATGGVITCASNSIQIQGASNTPGATYSWDGPGNFTSNDQNPSVSTPGLYVLTVTAPNGCTSTANAQVDPDANVPDISVNDNLNLDCNVTSVNLGGASATQGVTFNWTGPNGFTSNDPDPTVNIPGSYILTVVNPSNNCSAVASAIVTQDINEPGADAQGGTLTCTDPSFTISGSSPANNVTWSWTGPNGFASIEQNPDITLPGDYVLVVTGQNGCTSSATAVVLADQNAPVAAASAGTLTCSVTALPLNGSANQSVSFAWTGPNGFSSNEQNPVVNEPGDYTLVVTAANGCTDMATTTMQQDIAPPDIDAAGVTLSCANPSGALGGSSQTPGATYAWTGPGGFNSADPNPVVGQVGDYTLVVTGPNGCTSSATVAALPDFGQATLIVFEPDILTCALVTVGLNAVIQSNASPLQSVMWTGPAGFSSDIVDPQVSEPGVYTLVVTLANGCTSSAQANVAQNITPPDVSASGATLTCAVPTITLAGASNTPNAAYAWTGPNGFTANEQNPAVNEAGDYILTVTGPNGCTSSATAVVLADQNAPVATASAGTLTCSVTALPLNGSANQSVSFAWTGPNGFSSNEQNPVVNEPGDYTLVVTAANGCTDMATTTMQQDIAPPDIDAAGVTLSCANPSGALGGSSQTPGATYAWTGPGGFNSADPNPVVGQVGDYTLVVTGPNGCTSSATVAALPDFGQATLIVFEPDILTCALVTVGLNAVIQSNASPLQSVMWTGPAGFSSDIVDPQVSEPGVYTLVVTLANGCTSSAQANVTQNITPPNANASGATLTCAIPTVTLSGVSTTPNATYAWTGPNGFTSNNQNPTVSEAGDYILTVTGPNGCVNTAVAVVDQNIVPPGANADSSNDLDCDDLTTVLSATTTSGVSFAWSGPNGFMAATAITSASAPGTYQVVVTGSNGCTSVAQVNVAQDVNEPGADALGGELSCTAGVITLTGSSPTTSVTWAWTGPNGFTSAVQNPQVMEPGQYILTVTGANACTSSATAIVLQNTNAPDVAIDGGGILTCSQTELTLEGITNTAGATVIWTVPGGGTLTQANILISQPGSYIFTVTGPNGCISTQSINIAQDIQPPQDVTANAGQLDCANPSINLSGSSGTGNVTWAWTGPNAFSSDQQNPVITAPGVYVLTVTNTTNGCTSSATAVATQDLTTPQLNSAADILTCAVKSVVLQTSTSTPNVSFAWTGPNGFMSNEQSPAVTAPGAYVLTGTALSSSCTATFTVNVEQDINPPGASAQGVILSCSSPTGTISGSSPSANVSYLWEGPGGFTSTQQNPTVSLTGQYTLTVTSLVNGCTSIATAQVDPDASIPQLSASGGLLTCSITSITLSGNSNAPGVTWQWSGPGGFVSNEQNPQVSVPGNYTLTVTAPNGCSNSTGATVNADVQAPTLTLGTPGQLNCTTTQVSLSVSVQQQGNFTFEWSTQNGNILAGANTQTSTVNQAGAYQIVVTNTQNGCTSIATVQVSVDPSTPSGVNLQVRDITCYGLTNGAITVQSVEGGTPPLLYSLDGSPLSGTVSFTSLPPGPHTLLVQDINGCEYETVVTLFEPEELIVDLGPDTTIKLGSSLSLSLDNIVNFPDRITKLTVTPPGLLDTVFCANCVITPTSSFRYRVVVSDANGCTAQDDRLVIVNRQRCIFVPTAFNPGSDMGNEVFMIYGGQDVERIISFAVYDRWGELVHSYNDFQPNDYNSGWNGNFRGNPANPAVFVWYAEILFKDGLTELFKGDVTLTR